MKKFSASSYVFLVLISSLILTACNNNTSPESSEKKLKIVTSFYPSYEIVKTIGGDKIETINEYVNSTVEIEKTIMQAVTSLLLFSVTRNWITAVKPKPANKPASVANAPASAK